MFPVLFVVFQVSTVKKLREKIMEKLMGPRNLMLNIPLLPRTRPPQGFSFFFALEQRLIKKGLIILFQKWYFVTKIVLTYCEKKCSSDGQKILKLKAEGREFAKFLRSLEQFIQTVKGQNNFW